MKIAALNLYPLPPALRMVHDLVVDTCEKGQAVAGWLEGAILGRETETQETADVTMDDRQQDFPGRLSTSTANLPERRRAPWCRMRPAHTEDAEMDVADPAQVIAPLAAECTLVQDLIATPFQELIQERNTRARTGPGNPSSPGGR